MLFVVEMVAANVMFSLIGFEEDSHKFKDLMEQVPMYGIFALAVILAPLAEEFMFRGFLRYPLTIIGMIGFGLIGMTMYLKSIDYINPAMTLVMLVMSLGILAWLIKSESMHERIQNGFIKYFGVVFYASVVIFAYVHIFNFHEVEQWYYTPVLVLPQFILALYLGYIRVRNNIWTSIYIHALNNAIPTALLIMMPDAI